MRATLRNLCITHLGIVFDHALGTEPEEWTSRDKEQRNRAKEKLVEKLEQHRPEVDAYRTYIEDLKSVLGEPTVVRFEGPLAVGLGQGHLLEQGLTLHHLFGTPLIHGSAVKGVCLREALLQCGLLAAAERSANRNPAKILDFGSLIEDLKAEGKHDEAESARALQQVFGDPEGAGRVRFHDALWMPDDNPPLVSDVTTPHNQAWYMPDNVQRRPLPDDMSPPIPVKNLVVRPRSRFYFWVCSEHEEWREPLANLLLSALKNLGIGAKTNSGYGVAALPTENTPLPPTGPPPGGKPVTGTFARHGGNARLLLSNGTSLEIVNPEVCGDRIGKKFKGIASGKEVWIEGPA